MDCVSYVLNIEKKNPIHLIVVAIYSWLFFPRPISSDGIVSTTKKIDAIDISIFFS